MEDATHISVKVSNGQYNVSIGRGALKALPLELSRLNIPRVCVVSDSTVARLHWSGLSSVLPQGSVFFEFPYGESSKTPETVLKILNFLADNGFTRNDAVLAFGGGVTGDVAGFAASVYLRGIRVVQMPTTLLAAIDSSVGGKTGVDLPQGKNLMGSFWQPSAVICDTELLETLPQEDYLDGIAEALKCGVIGDEGLFGLLEECDDVRGIAGEIISPCVSLKARFVEMDEFDRGDRALLNFGHTIGHAVELASDYGISHGRAVGIGMVRMTRYAEKRGLCHDGLSNRIANVLKRHGLPTECDYSWAELKNGILHDKKRAASDMRIVYPLEIGHCVSRLVPTEELVEI